MMNRRADDGSFGQSVLPSARQLAEADRLIPKSLWPLLRRIFTPRGLPFFEFYIELKRINLGQPVLTDLRHDMKMALNRLIQVTSPVDGKSLSPVVVNMIADARPILNTLLFRLEHGRVDDLSTWIKLNAILVPLIVEVCRDKGLYLRAIQTGTERWATFRKMSNQQEAVERLRDYDPESYALMQQKGKAMAEIDAAIERRIKATGHAVQRQFIMGRPVFIGVDPETGEERVYDRDGDVISVEAFKLKRSMQQRAMQQLTRAPNRTEVPLKDLRILSDEDVDNLEGNIEWASLSDDKAKQGRITRIFACKRASVFVSSSEGIRIEKPLVIVSGRFKGIYLDDMVNSQGRLIEGTAYTYSPLTGREGHIPKKMDPGQREPYVTVADLVTTEKVGRRVVERKEQKLYLKIPGTRQFTDLRNAIKGLACNTGAKRGCIPSISYHSVKGSKAAGFYFDPKDFGIIMESLQGMSLSKGALELVRGYYQDLARAEQATAKENLGNYSADALGGFKVIKKDRDTGEISGFDLLTKQKQALAWMDANGNRGVCALETGVGKCVREDTLVITTKGLVPIRDLNPGIEEPDTHAPIEGWSVLVDGKAFPVKNFYYGGLKPTIKVRTRRGFEVEGSLIHPLLVRTPDGQETWVRTPDLAAGDYLCIERKEADFPAEDPVLSVPTLDEFQQASRNPNVTFTHGSLAEFPVPDRMTPDLGRLLGYIVAEGWTNSRKGFAISQCPEKNPEVRADIEDLLRRLMGWTAKPEKDIQVQSVFLREYLLRMGLGMGLAKDKTVPKVILHSSKETVRQFIRGLVDAEGHVGGENHNHIEFNTASEQLGRELQILLLRFGIISSRRPKKVEGYEHTYWKLTITGQDAIDYGAKIGFVSARKQAAVEDTGVARNSNLDVVPHMAPAVGSLFDAMLTALNMNVSQFRHKLGSASFDSTVNHVRLGRRNPTYSFLRKMLSMAVDSGCHEHPSFKLIAQVVDRRFFYDPIEAMEESEAVVMDVEVDDPTHCFVGNGVMNHNTLTTIGMMQKLVRDGIGDEDASYQRPDGSHVRTNGRFLFVCPTSLKGNLPKEIRAFISDPRELLDRVDVISYGEFSGSSKSKKVPKSIKGVDYWKGRPWEPSEYVAIFFDEAQEMKNPGSSRAKAAINLWHPRKICLTASPMTKSPMEAYVLAAITNNKPLHGRDPEARANREEMKRFKDRFCEVIGGRIIGVKQDPMIKRDLDTWVKRNIFYADKTDVEEFELPALRPETHAVEMAPEVEALYRSVSGQFPKVMRGLVSKFRDRGTTLSEARDPEIERMFSMTFRPIVSLMNGLANYPAETMVDIAHIIETGTMPDGKPVNRLIQYALQSLSMSPDDLRVQAATVGNPKLESAEHLIRSKLNQTDGGSRTLLFADDRKLCMMAGLHLSKKIAGKHVVALNNTIHIFEAGTEIEFVEFEIDPEVALKVLRDPQAVERLMQETGGVSRHALPFRSKAMRRHPEIPAHDLYNTHYKAAQWQQFVLKEVVTPNSFIKTCTLLGMVYQFGHNLQAFNTVVHLDRNTWSNENMKQRTARAWRQGQSQPVDEITIDATYRASDDGVPRDEFDRTLDEIRSYFQKVEGDLFDRIIKDAQSVALGAEWASIKQRDASNVRLDRKVLELMTSPYIGRSRPPGT